MIKLITGSAGQGKTLELFRRIILDSRLHGKQSLIFTEDSLFHREDINAMINKESVPKTLICEMSLDGFLKYVEIGNINPVIPTSKTVRIGVDYSVLTPRVVSACHKLSKLGYDVYVTCQIMRQSAPVQNEFEKLFN